jgi:hypothetical protein
VRPDARYPATVQECQQRIDALCTRSRHLALDLLEVSTELTEAQAALSAALAVALPTGQEHARWISTREAVQYTGLSDSKLCDMALHGLVRSSKVGRSRRYSLPDLVRFMERGT